MILNFLSNYLSWNARHKGMISQQMCSLLVLSLFYILSSLLHLAVVDLFTSMQTSVKCRPSRNSSFWHSPYWRSSHMLNILARLKQWLIRTLKLKWSGTCVYTFTAGLEDLKGIFQTKLLYDSIFNKQEKGLMLHSQHSPTFPSCTFYLSCRPYQGSWNTSCCRGDAHHKLLAGHPAMAAVKAEVIEL